MTNGSSYNGAQYVNNGSVKGIGMSGRASTASDKVGSASGGWNTYVGSDTFVGVTPRKDTSGIVADVMDCFVELKSQASMFVVFYLG